MAIADADIILAAMDEAAIPAPVKPMALRVTGAAVKAKAVGRGTVWGWAQGKDPPRNLFNVSEVLLFWVALKVVPRQRRLGKGARWRQRGQ